MPANKPLEGINTAPYNGRVSATRQSVDALQADIDREIRKDTRDARLIGAVLILSCLLIGSVGANIYQGILGIREVGFAVLVDQAHNMTPLMRVDELQITPEETVIIDKLKDWTEWIRQITSDAKIMGDNQQKADAHMTEAAKRQLEEFRLQQKERQKRGVRVDITEPDVRLIPKTRSYTVEWQERTYDADGGLLMQESARWHATLTIGEFHTQAAKEARSLRWKKREYRNMVGVLVDGITWDSRPLYGHTTPPRKES